jgi:tetratricopeptide (TPR) repeat protein
VSAFLVIVLLLQAGAPAAAQPSAGDRDALLARAADAAKSGDRAEAKRLFGAAAERYHSVAALMQLARLESEEGDGEGAMRALREARSLAPNSEAVLTAFAEVSLKMQSPVPAILTLEALTRMYPDEPRHPYLLGVALMRAGDVVAAIEPLRKANALDPDRPLTLLALGLAYNSRKEYSEARPLLRRALDVEPDNADTRAALAEAEAGVGDLENAERDATRAMQIAPANATANFVVGLVRMAQQRYAEARDALLAAAVSDPASPKTEYQLSLVYARLGDQAASEEHRALYERKLRAIEQAVAALHAPGAGGAAR